MYVDEGIKDTNDILKQVLYFPTHEKMVMCYVSECMVKMNSTCRTQHC